MKAFHNAVHDFTERDKAVQTWHDLKGASQMSIFERQEKRRKAYESMQLKKAVLVFLVKYVVPVGAVIVMLWAYSDMLK